MDELEETDGPELEGSEPEVEGPEPEVEGREEDEPEVEGPEEDETFSLDFVAEVGEDLVIVRIRFRNYIRNYISELRFGIKFRNEVWELRLQELSLTSFFSERVKPGQHATSYAGADFGRFCKRNSSRSPVRR